MTSDGICIQEDSVKLRPYEVILIKEEVGDKFESEDDVHAEWETSSIGATHSPDEAVPANEFVEVVIKEERTVLAWQQFGETTAEHVKGNELQCTGEEVDEDHRHVDSLELKLPSGCSFQSTHASVSGLQLGLNDQEPKELETCKTFPSGISDNASSLHLGENLFSCSLCPAKFPFESHMKRHIRTHTGEKPFSCPICSAKFTQKYNLNVHFRTHVDEKKSFACSVCPAKFTQKSSLNVHVKKHTGEKLFSCSLCCAEFTQKSHLVVHFRTHTGEKPFSCVSCSAKFAQKVSLNMHARAHTGEKPFSCSLCSATFCSENNAKRHIRTHTSEKCFSCSICSAKFSQKSRLDVHIGTHCKKPV